MKMHVAGLLLVGFVLASGQVREIQRVPRELSAEQDTDDRITIQTNTLLDHIREIHGLSSLEEMQRSVGSIHGFVTDKLKDVSSLLRELSKQTITENQRTQASSLVQCVHSLGYFLGLDMQQDESRRLTIDSVTIFVSKFQSSNFKGLHFSQNSGESAISIPYTASLPSKDPVISIASTVSGVKNIMPRLGNDSLTSDILSTSFVDDLGDELALTLNADEVFVKMKIDAEKADSKEPLCVFRHDRLGETGSWSTSGCRTVYPGGDGSTVHCYCSHLSTFGIVLAQKVNENRVGVVAWVGCSLTILFCVLTALVFIGYRLMHSIRCYIRFSFLTALAMAEMLFLCVTYTEAPAICTMVAAGTHFFVTASFTWLLSYALFLGNDFTGDVAASLQIAHYTFIGWAIPFVVVLITFVWRYDTYVQDDYCWISQTTQGLRYAYIVPIGIVIVVTLSVLMYDIGVYVNIQDTKKKFSLKVTRSGLRSCCTLLPLLSLVWILTDFVVMEGNLWLQVVLSILNAILGVMVFLIMFYFNEEVMVKRKNGKSKFKIRKKNHSTEEASTPRKRPTKMTMIWGGFSTRHPSPRASPTRETAEEHVCTASTSSEPATMRHTKDTSMAPVERPPSSHRDSKHEMSLAREQFFHGTPEP